MDRKVAIVGAGVSGLTCGVVLAEHGYRTAIFAKDVGQQTTSSVAAAVWFPYHVHPDAHSNLRDYRRTEFTRSNSSRRSRSDRINSGALSGGDPAGQRGRTRPDRAGNDAFHI